MHAVVDASSPFVRASSVPVRPCAAAVKPWRAGPPNPHRRRRPAVIPDGAVVSALAPSLGATPSEIAAALPRDELLPRTQFRCTRAITIDAPPGEVWPWLVQVGYPRGGFYSNDLLDNLGHPSARTIIPELQHLRVGQWVPMSPSTPTVETPSR